MDLRCDVTESSKGVLGPSVVERNTTVGTSEVEGPEWSSFCSLASSTKIPEKSTKVKFYKEKSFRRTKIWSVEIVM